MYRKTVHPVHDPVTDVPKTVFLFLYLCIMNSEIKHWLANESRDYMQGVSLLERFGTNANLVRVFRARSPRFALPDLMAEVRRLAATAPEDTPSQPEAANTPAPKPAPTVPTLVEKAKTTAHDVWVRLSRLHRKLFDTGEGNGKKEVEERKRILAEKEPLIERYNSVYEAKEMFFAGKLTEDQLKQVVEGLPLEKVLHPEPPKEEKLLSDLTDLQLARKFKAAKDRQNRSRNKLRYQQESAAKEENPMPDCPRRKLIEEKMAATEKELVELQKEMSRRGL